ncbi:reverse transcriptase domain-containing protein [Tanacetum coccineum]
MGLRLSLPPFDLQISAFGFSTQGWSSLAPIHYQRSRNEDVNMITEYLPVTNEQVSVERNPICWEVQFCFLTSHLQVMHRIKRIPPEVLLQSIKEHPGMIRTSEKCWGSLLALKCLVWFMKYYANVRRTVADFSHAPLNEYSPSPDDKKQWSLVWFDFYKIPLCTLMTSRRLSKLEYKFQDKENSEDIFSFGSALEDFISVVFVHDRNIPKLELIFKTSVNEVFVLNISEEDVEPQPNSPLQEIIILDPDDQPMWESAKTVASTPNSIIVRPDVDEKFVINSTYLKMIQENKFDDYLRANPHDHIREFLVICDMFKYGETQSEAVKLLIFPLSLCNKAKTWFDELNEESITSWDQMRRAFTNKFFPPSLFNRLLLEIRSFSQNVCESLIDAWLRLKNMLRKCHGHGLTKGEIIRIFYRGLDESTQGILDGTTRGIFLYKSPNQAFQFLEGKVLFKLNWSTKFRTEHNQRYVAFTDRSNNDNSRLMEKLEALTIKIDSQFQSLKEEMHEMRKNYNNR